MGKFRVKVTKNAQKDIAIHLKSRNKLVIKNIGLILIELSETPFEGIGKPEPLKYEYSGYWSRKINKKDRMIYYLEDETITVYVVSAMGHYSDK